MNPSALLKLSACMLLLSGCSNLTTFDEAGKVARLSLFKRPDAWQAAQTRVGDVQVGWIHRLGDPKLVELTKLALAANADLKVSAANMERSFALARQAGASLKPSLTQTGSVGKQGNLDSSSTRSDSYEIGLSVSWEIDVWGRIQAGRNSAVASAQAAEADYIYSRHSLAAAVARSYFQACESRLQIGISQRSLDILKETDRIVASKFKAGSADAQDMALSKADLASGKAGLEQVRGAYRESIRSLEVLRAIA